MVIANVIRYGAVMAAERTGVLDRADQRLMRVMVHLVAAATALAYVIGPLWAWVTGSPISRVIQLREGLGADGLRPGARVGAVQGEVELAQPSAAVRLTDLAPGILLAGGVALATWAVLRTLRSFAQGRTFTDAVVTGLRVLGMLLIFLPIAVGLANGIADAVFADSALQPVDGVDLSLAFDLGPLPITLAGGLFVLALGQAFARGRAMEHELEGLV